MTEFEQVYQTYFTDVYRYVLSLCRNEELAQEITQETFFKALQSIDRFDRKCRMYVWLCQIAKNTYFTHLQKQKRHESAVFEKKTWADGSGSLNHATFYIAISGLTRQEWETYSSDPAYEEILAENAAPALADIFPPADVKKICIGSKKDYVVLWEEGMELPAATEEQIEWYENGRR